MTKQEILQNRSEAITFEKYIDNLQIIPTSATVTITDSEGNDLPDPVIDAVCSIDSYGKISYTLSATNTADLGENFTAEFKYIYNTVEYLQRILFNIVINRLNIIITDQDLIDDYSQLREYYSPINGEVSSIGDINEIIDGRNFNGQKDYWKGGHIKILSGTIKDFDVKVTAFDETSGTFTLKKSMPANITQGDKFIAYKSFENEISRAFDEIKDYLSTQGFRPALIMNDLQLKEIHITLSIAKILHAIGKRERDAYEDYINKYYSQRASLKLLYDEDETGNPADAVESRPQTTFLR